MTPAEKSPTRPAVVDTPALREWLTRDRPPRVLDVRTPGEFSTSHIPGSCNVPLALARVPHNRRTGPSLGAVPTKLSTPARPPG